MKHKAIKKDLERILTFLAFPPSLLRRYFSNIPLPSREDSFNISSPFEGED